MKKRTMLASRFEEFLVYRSTAKLSEHTIKAYRQDFAAIAVRLATTAGATVDQLGCDVIDKARMRGAFADFAADHSAASIRRCWSTWNNLCDYLFTSDIIEANPMAAVLRPQGREDCPEVVRPGCGPASPLDTNRGRRAELACLAGTGPRDRLHCAAHRLPAFGAGRDECR